MKLLVNGKEMEYPEGTTVKDLVDSGDITLSDFEAPALNNELLDVDELDKEFLHDNDEVIVINLIEAGLC